AGMSGLVNFVRVNPTTDSMGMVRGFEIADGVKQLNIDGGITLEDRSDFADRVDELMGTPEPTYDNTKGHVVVGFTFQEGVTDGNGMNATVEVGADDTWSTFIIHDDPAVVLQLNGAPIPEVCPSVDVACREEGNEDVPLFVPNVTVGTAKVTPVNGGGFTCSPRVTPGIGFPVSYWPVFADTRTLIVMDCGE
ncbi:MAG: hypothetical protein KC417_12940, partial [Myxococcales bacterium]|nr:hypothetical protein [Myxococcales bacterium]